MIPTIWIDSNGFFRSVGGVEVLFLPQPKNSIAQCAVRSDEANYERPFTEETSLRVVLKCHASSPGVVIDIEALAQFGMETKSQKTSETYRKRSGRGEDRLDAYF